MGAAAGYAGWASGTVPFTASADVAVSVPSALLVLGLVGRWTWGRRPGTGVGSKAVRGTASSAPWLVLVVLVTAVELASYFHGGPRTLYPTISSSAESLFRIRAVKAAAFLGWLLGGWYVVAR